MVASRIGEDIGRRAVDATQLDLSDACRQTPQDNRRYISQFHLSIPELPPSINSLYSTGRGGKRFMTKEGKVFKRLVSLLARNASAGRSLDPYCFYVLRVTFFMPIRFKNGTVRKWDVTNHLKALEDALAKVLELDDSHFVQVSAGKSPIRHGEKEETQIAIEPFVPLPLLEAVEAPFATEENQ